MTKEFKNVCVYASSSNYLEEIFYKQAQELGELLGKNGYNIVYGGSRLGLMFACSNAVKSNGGKIFGVMPERLANMGCANPDDCDEFFLTSGMRERKAKLDEISDAIIAVPGGFGTLEELSEMIVQKQLGYNSKPIVILNTDGFYDKLLEFFEVIIKREFAHTDSTKIYFVAKTPQEAIDYIESYKPSEIGLKFARSNG